MDAEQKLEILIMVNKFFPDLSSPPPQIIIIINVYKGEWQCNERHGRGTMHWYDRGEQYSGEWVNGIHGDYVL